MGGECEREKEVGEEGEDDNLTLCEEKENCLFFRRLYWGRFGKHPLRSVLGDNIAKKYFSNFFAKSLLRPMSIFVSVILSLVEIFFTGNKYCKKVL